MSPARYAFFSLPLFIALGCQHAAWKAGATAEDFKRDELACRQRPSDGDVSQCLRQKGWSLANPAAPADADRTPSPALTTAAPSIPAADPAQRIAVQTWWKAGAHAADFQHDADRCLAQLGEQHLPDYSKHLYTPAMLDCLSERGWFAGKDPVYTPLR